MSQWDSVDTSAYDRKWAEMAKKGHNPHGEADFVARFAPESVLDAGCGTGRLAIELARRGVTTVGVDLDGPMIEAASAKAPELEWHHADLASLRLDRTFDAVVMAGNVMIFVAPGTEAAVMDAMAAHVSPSGVLISGFQLGRGLDVATYDQMAHSAGMTLLERFATWDGEPFVATSTYAVSVHRRLTG